MFTCVDLAEDESYLRDLMSDCQLAAGQFEADAAQKAFCDKEPQSATATLMTDVSKLPAEIAEDDIAVEAQEDVEFADNKRRRPCQTPLPVIPSRFR